VWFPFQSSNYVSATNASSQVQSLSSADSSPFLDKPTSNWSQPCFIDLWSCPWEADGHSFNHKTVRLFGPMNDYVFKPANPVHTLTHSPFDPQRSLHFWLPDDHLGSISLVPATLCNLTALKYLVRCSGLQTYPQISSKKYRTASWKQSCQISFVSLLCTLYLARFRSTGCSKNLKELYQLCT
jgi:hypothetical protein